MYFEGYFFIIPEKSAFFSVLFSLPRVVFPLLLHLKIQIIYQSFNTNYV